MNQFDIPIVFIVFNRPEATQRVFDEIRKMKPLKLFVIADGPRQNKDQDEMLCKQTREVIESVDWSCGVQKNYAAVNMGCGKRISSGLDWVFEQCDQAIILEDDCVPAQEFFTFCKEMLVRYKDHEKVLSISGFSAPTEQVRTLATSYYFSKFFGMWGWATWKRAWKLYDFKMKQWSEIKQSGILYRQLESKEVAGQWERDLDNIYKNNGTPGIVDTWDFQFSLTHFLHGGFAIKPARNLIENIGVGGVEATHTILPHKLGRVKSEKLSWPLVHPHEIVWNKDVDLEVFDHYYQKSEFWFRIKQVIKKLPFMKAVVKKILYRS